MIKPTRKTRATSEPDKGDLPAETTFEIFAEGVRDYAIYMLDPEGKVVSWTTGAAVKGYTANEVMGKDHAMFFTPEDMEGGAPGETLRIAAKEGRHLTEGWRLRKDGTKMWAEVLTSALLRDAEEKVRRLCQGGAGCHAADEKSACVAGASGVDFRSAGTRDSGSGRGCDHHVDRQGEDWHFQSGGEVVWVYAGGGGGEKCQHAHAAAL